MRTFYHRLIACYTFVLVCLFSLTANASSRPTGEALSKEVEELLSQLTLKEKISLVHANSKFTVAGVERLGIKEMWLSDGPHGVREQISKNSWASANWTDDHATYLPVLTAVTASWDPKMASLHGNVLGSEARHREKDIILGPGVNMARLPTYGRNFEYFGEDPYLASKMIVPEIQAIQSHDVAACVKHYALNTQEWNRRTVNAMPDDRTLREIYLPAFEAAVKEGKVKSVMGAYNQYMGTNANQSEKLVKQILKGEWGFEGVLLTDWHVYINTYDAAMAGLDLEMGTEGVASYDDYYFGKPLLAMIKEGKVPEAVLDDKVRRILKMQISIGMMDDNRKKGQRNTKKHQNDARTIAENGVVLLKNTNKTLPFDKDLIKNVLVLGPNAAMKHGRGGGSSMVKSLYEVTPLQGIQEYLGDRAKVTYLRAVSNKEVDPIHPDFVSSRGNSGTPSWHLKTASNKRAIHLSESRFDPKEHKSKSFVMRGEVIPENSGLHTFKVHAKGKLTLKINDKAILNKKVKGGEVINQGIELQAGKAYQVELNYTGNEELVLGWDTPNGLSASPEQYLALAKKSDAVIYFGGLNHAYDREGRDRADMSLPGSQNQVIASLQKANKNTIVFLMAGSAVEMPWEEKINTIVWSFYSGMEGGRAFANVLFGDVNPSGKMPVTLPKKYSDTAPIKLNDYNGEDSLYKEGVFMGYRWFDQQNIEPTFPFGHGLSYTEFKYSALSLPKKVSSKDENVSVSVLVKNTGTVAGAEVVQLYIGDERASVPRPAKELKGFNKVFLQPGEEKRVEISLTQRDFAFWSENINNWKVEPGKFKVHLGASSRDIRLVGDITYH